MTNLVKQNDEIVSSLVLQGDISKLTSSQRVEYYKRFCESLGLNPLTQPFEIINFKGKSVLYAKRDATDQLRKIHKVSIKLISKEPVNDIYLVVVEAIDKDGRVDIGTGGVPIKGLTGEALCNAIMKAETKAKRRATLSICGLGMLDESETDTINNYNTEKIDIQTGEVKQIKAEEVKEVKEDNKLISKSQEKTLIALINKANPDKRAERLKKVQTIKVSQYEKVLTDLNVEIEDWEAIAEQESIKEIKDEIENFGDSELIFGIDDTLSKIEQLKDEKIKNDLKIRAIETYKQLQSKVEESHGKK